jgi:hypothetical protein
MSPRSIGQNDSEGKNVWNRRANFVAALAAFFLFTSLLLDVF